MSDPRERTAAALRVVTLPPSEQGQAAVDFAQAAKSLGAQVLEVRSDLHEGSSIDAGLLAQVLPLLVSERATPLTPTWLRAARWVDRELGLGLHAARPSSPDSPLQPGAMSATALLSHHAPAPLSTAEAVALWTAVNPSPQAWIKHVEPLGSPASGTRLLKTQEQLVSLFGKGRVTVLATGTLALPFRCLLARRNAFDYLAVSAQWAAAPGQRLLADAVRERKGRPGDSRAAILGSGIVHSRSPRIHPQPFDRIDLPADAPVGELVDALIDHYRGFAVTSPFKKVLAAHLGVPLPAINTLVRRGHGYDADNTDVQGAQRVLQRLGEGTVTVLGDGGATEALRMAAAKSGRVLQVLRRADISSQPCEGACVWTWPSNVEVPQALCFQAAKVGIISYGPPGRQIATEVRKRGGVPVMLGAAWLIAQARVQRKLWAAAT